MMTTQQNQISDSLVEKIKGLLRLSTSQNQHEAELAMQKAKALAVKYEIDLVSIDAFNDNAPKNEPITRESIEAGKRLSVSQHHISRLLIDYFNVKVIYSGGRWGGKQITFIGRGRDIEIASYLNDYLNQEFLRLWRKYYDENEKNGVTISHRAGFIYGLAQGLGGKLAESQTQTEQESFAASPAEKVQKIKECYALAIVNHKKNLEDKVAEFYPHLRKSGVSHRIRNYDSVGAGRVLGRSISLNRPLSNGSSAGRISC